MQRTALCTAETTYHRVVGANQAVMNMYACDEHTCTNTADALHALKCRKQDNVYARAHVNISPEQG